MQLSYYVNASVTAQEVADVFESSGIKRPISDLARIQQMIDAAPLLISVREDNKLVGIARSLTDFCYCCYLSDLAVRKEYQSAEIGRELIEQTKKEIGDSCSLVLLSAPNAMDYYPRVGLTPAHHAFYSPRKK